ncbi:MAG: hypothetical protein KDN18_06735 [Verrucomicrobiae bacterium]|nr:hypothetical protein [Verrucomicrobiae bacterium]
MKCSARWRFAACAISFSLCLLQGEDWSKIASETDEPAFGMRIEAVTPGSQAETIGLKPGDYIYQVGQRAMRGFVDWRREGEETLFFCRDGKKGTAAVKSGLIGVNFVESFRPQIAYLRGEIGRSDPRWDEAVVEALSLLAPDPANALKQWESARALEYPADELDSFVRAFTAWRLGRNVPVREAYAAIDGEFKTMPRLYAAYLEDMAYATGQVDLLRSLHLADPDSSKVTAAQLKTWETLSANPTEARRLLDLAKRLKGRDLVPELVPLEGEDSPKWAERLEKLRTKGSFAPSAGRYQATKLRFPEGVRDYHLSLSCQLFVWEFHDRWSSTVRLGVHAPVEEGKRLGNRVLAELGVSADRYIGTRISCRGGYDAQSHYHNRPGKPIPVKGDEKEGEKLKMSGVFRIDLIRLGNEIAAYCDGVPYCQMPIDPASPTSELHWFTSGISARINRFEAWSLNPETPIENP